MKRNIVTTSLVTAMLLTTGSFASQITGADVEAGDTRKEGTQYGFGGLNLDNINVILSNGEDFNQTTGEYSHGSMARDDTFASLVFNVGDDTSVIADSMGYVHQKPWPLSEPMGLKVINNDDQKNGKPVNCIMGSSYLNAEETNLDSATPTPVLCSSEPGSNKRFSLALLQNTVQGVGPEAYGNPVDLVFNLDNPSDTESNITRYQVFQKVNNFTETRLEGLRIEVLDVDGNQHPELSLSLGINEATKTDTDGNVTVVGDLFAEHEMAFYPPGLWGDNADKPHLPLVGWFGIEPSGYKASVVVDDYNNTIETGLDLAGNYPDLFGEWIPDQWVVYGVHEVDENDPDAEAELIAYWGTTPTEDFATDTPDWHYGYAEDFATPSDAEVAMWAANPEKYPITDVEDLPNLSLNYIIEVGQASLIKDGKFILRFTPKVADTNIAPSYVEYDSSGDRILPTLPVAPVNPIEPTPENPIESTGGGGGCTYNPNSNSFDMSFLMMIALGSLYAFRRRFIK